jgi:hypothetical protein
MTSVNVISSLAAIHRMAARSFFGTLMLIISVLLFMGINVLQFRISVKENRNTVAIYF